MGTLCFFSSKLIQIRPNILPIIHSHSVLKPNFATLRNTYIPITIFTSNPVKISWRFNRLRSNSSSTFTVNTKNYEFLDGPSEVELRLILPESDVQNVGNIVVDADENSLSIKVQHSSGSLITLVETDLYDKIKPGETIWYIDDDELVVNMKKHDSDVKWPDIVESWESLTAGALQFLKGTSIYMVGESTVINQKVARELAVGLGYTPLHTKELLESFAKQTIDSWVNEEGPDSIAEAERSILESLSSHVRTVVSTLGGRHGAAGRADKWQHLYSGFTVWLSESDGKDEDSAKEEARRHIQDNTSPYSNADVVVKLHGWDPDHAKTVAQASLSALKRLITSDKKLPGKKSLYIRLGCRGDWPNIEPPGASESASSS